MTSFKTNEGPKKIIIVLLFMWILFVLLFNKIEYLNDERPYWGKVTGGEAWDLCSHF